METFFVREPGAFTTVQDAGRYGFQRFGVPVSGALDKFAFVAANLLVGNPETSAALEITFTGPRLEALADGLAAVTGADMPVALNGKPQPLWESFRFRKGDLIGFKPAAKGVRAYLAVSGGILAPGVMGSRSTCVLAGIGGFDGRPLRKADVISTDSATSIFRLTSIPEQFRPQHSNSITLKSVAGPQIETFRDSMELFFQSQYTVTSKADRMGYRLEGPVIPFASDAAKSIISEPSVPGIVQVPADGLPIIILVEQTAGGYAKIATVISPDLDLVAQARPGDLIRFSPCDILEARRIHLDYRHKLLDLKNAIVERDRMEI
ncbi:MAG: biotin-dependent carboxyltransferase family protein [Deltaproteobacteria bacterium]|nr:biotin-dependent carboxyltransferase family protein [Deltaproteobacteria bacterium]